MEVTGSGQGGMSQTSLRPAKVWAEVGDSLPSLLSNLFIFEITIFEIVIWLQVVLLFFHNYLLNFRVVFALWLMIHTLFPSLSPAS